MRGRTLSGVYSRRNRLRADAHKRPWTEAEDRHITRMPPAVAAKYLGRSELAIEPRRKKLGFPNDRPSKRPVRA